MSHVLKRSIFDNRLAYMLVGCAYVVFAIVVLRTYFPWESVNFIIGLMGLPMLIAVNPKRERSQRFLGPAIVLTVLTFVFPERTMLFFAIGAALIGIIEILIGKLSLLALTTLFFMSPMVQYLASVFSFPLRLRLTGLAADVLKLVNADTTSAGNVISFKGNDFSVDPACAGIKMLLMSLLCSLFILAIRQRKWGKYVRWPYVLVFLASVFVLNLGNNLVRIIALIYFNIKPEHSMHDTIGLAGLILYVLLPSLFIADVIIRKAGKPITVQPTRNSGFKWSLAGHGLILVLMLLSFSSKNAVHVADAAVPQIEGYKGARYDKDVLQYKDASSLIYVKRIKGVFYSEHNPILCWLGNGYQFENIGNELMGGVLVTSGMLKNGKDILYTAWWYDNGTSKCVGQFEWRWNVLRGERQYSIINVTTSDRASLVRKINEIGNKGSFRPVL